MGVGGSGSRVGLGCTGQGVGASGFMLWGPSHPLPVLYAVVLSLQGSQSTKT